MTFVERSRHITEIQLAEKEREKERERKRERERERERENEHATIGVDLHIVILALYNQVSHKK